MKKDGYVGDDNGRFSYFLRQEIAKFILKFMLKIRFIWEFHLVQLWM